eukprot:7894161-Heterocapsa_arctica.AAC.1
MVFIQLIAVEDQAKLVHRDARPVLDLGLHVGEVVVIPDLDRDGVAVDGLHEDLEGGLQADCRPLPDVMLADR